MKLLLILVLALVGVWWWRNQRQSDKVERSVKPRASNAVAEDMVACPVCGLHVARSDALIGRRGAYCSVEHRRQAEP
jgi:uncharacterized protein